MKKLILLTLAAVGIGVLVKNKSEQLKAGAAKVTRDPRVQSALATASEKAAPVAGTLREKAGPVAETVREKAGPVAGTVREKAGPVAGTVKEKVGAATSAASGKLHKGDESLTPPPVPTEAEEVAETDPVSAPEFVGGDPLTDPLPGSAESASGPQGIAPEPTTPAAPPEEKPGQL